MKVNAYAVQDVKAHRYNRPFFMPTHVDAIRYFQQNCMNKESLWNTYPEDFRLMLIGEFDDETAKLTSCAETFMASAIDYSDQKPTPKGGGE